MRYNKQELVALASLPSNKFEKEGILYLTEKQEGFFRRAEVSLPRWCKLRGNLLFYLKNEDQFSSPLGVIVLENCLTVIRNQKKDFDGFGFVIEFNDGAYQRIATNTEIERYDWVEIIKMASCSQLNLKLKALRQKIQKKKGITTSQDSIYDYDICGQTVNKIEINEIPICESAISCDNLLCDGHGRSPNPSVVVQVEKQIGHGWIKYGRTEVIEQSSNPHFLCTIIFRLSFGLNASSMIRFTVYDVREKLLKIAVPLGSAEISLGVIQDTTRLRMPLKSIYGSPGFITITSWIPEQGIKTPRSPAKIVEQQKKHRRSQSLPPTLGIKLFVPPQLKLSYIFTNASFHTYRLHSGLGGDISVQELMMESQLCYLIPQQLLSIWILREKELLQEISGMGELGDDWRNKQIALLDKHLKLLNDYSQAKQNLQYHIKNNNTFYKSSSMKSDESLEFIPVNLHLQRMWAHNDTLKRSGALDIITVGAFTRHSGKSKTGGLIKLLQQTKHSPSKIDQNECKVQAANDAVQAIKQLRKEIVEIMSQLLCLAKSKNTKGMMPLCNEMIKKIRTLFNIWEPNLVYEAFEFIEKHRILEDPDNGTEPLSPFKKITQQLGTLNLKSPDLEDFATPLAGPLDLWPKTKVVPTKSPTTYKHSTTGQENGLKFSDSHFSVSLEEGRNECQSCLDNVNTDEHNANALEGDVPKNENELSDNFCEFDENGYIPTNCSIMLGYNGGFLDTNVMSSSPSANYYRPTEEPEPLDLTQLNIEASVICLVSKINFLCGQCSTPAAVSLRQPMNAALKSRFKNYSSDHQKKQQTEKQNSEVTDTPEPDTSNENVQSSNITSKNLNIVLTQTVGETTNCLRNNKFTDGLDLSFTSDWGSELRPSMRKLRQALDGLLKTARLIHSVQRLQQDMNKITANISVMYRRDVCFSQALTSLISGLMAKLWGTTITKNYLEILSQLGPLAYFEGLLSLYGRETDMWGDMCIAIEDLSAVNFTLIRSNIQRETNILPLPRIVGSRQSLTVLLPVPENVYCIMTSKEATKFKITPVFFNIGINEKATLSEALGYTREQHRSNWDNFDRLKQYHIRYKKLNFTVSDTPYRSEHNNTMEAVADCLNTIEKELRANSSKNVKILHLVEDACRSMFGLRFTSCKSAKDRTSMAVTLEQCRILQREFHLPASSLQMVLNTMRSEGTRIDNVAKNIGKYKFAFNLPQVLSLPTLYRPPNGSYGKAQQ